MAATTLATYDLDNMVTTAIDTMSTDPVNMLTDSGEKFLKTAAQRGRMFVVNDAENVRHTLIYNGGNATVNYVPDNLSGATLSAAATEVVTQNLWSLNASSRNINFPQSQPAGNVMDYVATVVKANMMEILNQEEALFVRGVADPTGTMAQNDPYVGDENYATALPMSLAGLIWGSTDDKHDHATTELFAGIKTSEIAKWTPHFATGSATAGIADDLIGDFQKAVMTASYSDVERPTHIYTTQIMFEKFLTELRGSAALPDPVHANLGLEGTATFAGMTIDWSRYLDSDAIWDDGDAAFTAEHPVLGINWNSLRLNVVRAGGINSDSVGFIRQIGSLQPHPTLTNLFKRLEWKRCWSLDNGRRSFFKISGFTDANQV
jgi:hypothetical protein